MIINLKAIFFKYAAFFAEKKMNALELMNNATTEVFHQNKLCFSFFVQLFCFHFIDFIMNHSLLHY